MAAEDLGKINPQMLNRLADDLIKRIEELPFDALGDLTRLMLESTGEVIRKREQAIHELAPEIFWLQGVQVAYALDDPDRKIYVLELLHRIVDQQRRIRLLERHVDDLTEKNIELAWRLEHKSD